MSSPDDEDDASGFSNFGSDHNTPDGDDNTPDGDASPLGSSHFSDVSDITGSDDVEMSDDNVSAASSSYNEDCVCENCDLGKTGFGFRAQNTHAHNCWNPDCEECQTRASGVQPWSVDLAPDCENPYIAGDSHMVETYLDGYNRVGIMPNLELVNLMKSGARSGRRFRDLKKELGPQMRFAREQMDLALNEMKDLKKRIQDLDKAIREPEEGAGKEEVKSQRKIRGTRRFEYTIACEIYKEQREILEPMAKALKREERMWMSTMRRVCDKQDAILTEAGVLDENTEPEWQDKDYKLESVGHEPEFLEFEEEQDEEEEDDKALRIYLEQQAKAAPPAQPLIAAAEAGEKTESEKQIERKETNESLESAIDVARAAHEKHHAGYKELLAGYVKDQTRAGRNATRYEYADEFTYIFLSEGKRVSTVLRDAEQALIDHETQVWAELPDGAMRLELDATGYHKNVKGHEINIRVEAFQSHQKLDREKVQGWQREVSTEENHWIEPVVDAPVVNGDEVAVVDEPALDEPEPAPKKRSRKREADCVIESNDAKKRLRNEAGEASAAPVTRVAHRYIFRTRKEPDPILAPKKRVARKAKDEDVAAKKTKGKRPTVEDDDEDDIASAPVVKKSKGKGKGKQLMVEDDENDVASAPTANKTKGKGRQPPVEDDDDNLASARAAKKSNITAKQPQLHDNSKEADAAAPLAALDDRNMYAALTEIPFFAPTAISHPLAMGDQLGAGVTICEAEADGRFLLRLWREKNGWDYL